MGDLAMTLRTWPFGAVKDWRGSRLHQAFMATHAVRLDHSLGFLRWLHDLGFHVEREHEAVPRTVLCLIKILRQKVVVGNVAVVTDCNSGVAGMLPTCEFRIHDMAVDARLGIVAQIAGGIAQPSDIGTHSKKGTRGSKSEELCFFG